MNNVIIWMLAFAAGWVFFFCLGEMSKYFMSRSVDKMLRTIETSDTDPYCLEDVNYGTVETDETGILISDRAEQSYLIPWRSITKVYAYKRDLLAVDLICVSVDYLLDGHDVHLEIHEEMSGYKDCIEVLDKYLSGIKSDWPSEVLFPAFETNHTVIWEK